MMKNMGQFKKMMMKSQRQRLWSVSDELQMQMCLVCVNLVPVSDLILDPVVVDILASTVSE